MYFDRCPVTIANSESPKSIMIPIAPTTGDDHKFTVTVCAHSQYTPLEFFFFNKESNAGNLLRNEVAVAPVHVDEFTSTDIPLVGSGTQASPYLIQIKGDYKNFLKFLANDKGRDKWYTLVKDIDFGGDTVMAVVQEFGFHGKFDGDGKHLTNAAVIGGTYGTNHYISLFPAITGGWVRNLSLSNVRLIAPTSGNFVDVYVGGFCSSLASYSENIILENIQVSNIDFGNPLSGFSVSNRVAIGGLLGYSTKYNNGGGVSLVACHFSQSRYNEFPIWITCTSMLFGGLIGYANNMGVSIANCQVNFGGSQGETGTEVSITNSCPYVGAAIGCSTSSVQIVNSLLIEGNIQFVGNPFDYVKKVIGKSSSVSGQGYINTTNLFFWKKSGENGTPIQVNDDF